MEIENRNKRELESARGYREWKRRKETEAKIRRTANEDYTIDQRSTYMHQSVQKLFNFL